MTLKFWGIGVKKNICYYLDGTVVKQVSNNWKVLRLHQVNQQVPWIGLKAVGVLVAYL